MKEPPSLEVFHTQFATKLKHAEHFQLCEQYSHYIPFPNEQLSSFSVSASSAFPISMSISQLVSTYGKYLSLVPGKVKPYGLYP